MNLFTIRTGIFQSGIPITDTSYYFYTTVPPGHTVHPSKVQKPNPQASLSTSSNAASTQNTFNGMSAQGAQIHMANYVTEPSMDTSQPFASLPRNIVGYNVMREDNSSSDNTSHKNSR